MAHVTFYSSRKSESDYFKWRKYRSFQTVDLVEKYRKVGGLKVLDVGCGYGALLTTLAEKGAIPLGIEINEEVISSAKRFMSSGIKIIKSDAQKLPFKDGSFDIVFLLDVIEHVDNPQKTITECKRVLKEGGMIYIEFTPYYSLIGHHLYDIIKWPIHLLPKQLIKWIIFKKIKNTAMTSYYWNLFKSLNKLKISRLQALLKSCRKIDEHFIIKYPGVFEIHLPFVNLIGPVKDFLTFSYIGIYLKSK